MSVLTSPGLLGHPDRTKWNEKYQQRAHEGGQLVSAEWLADVLRLDPPAGPVLELASGPSSAVIELAAQERAVTAIDVSDTALRLVEHEAKQRGLLERLTLLHADLSEWRAEGPDYALVACRYFWDPAVFAEACKAVSPGGLLVWEAPTRSGKSHVRATWRLGEDEPAILLPDYFVVLRETETSRETPHGTEVARRMIARRGTARQRAAG